MLGRKSPKIRHEIRVEGGHRPRAADGPLGSPPFGKSALKPPPPAAPAKTVNISAVPGVIVRVVGDAMSAEPDKGWQIAQMAERLFREQYGKDPYVDLVRLSDACVALAKRIVEQSYQSAAPSSVTG
jgi:hypothetical protein